MKVEGIPNLAEKILEKSEGNDNKQLKEWNTAVRGQSSEQELFDVLQRKFANDPCLLVSGFKESDLIKVVKEHLKKERKKEKGVILNEREIQFQKITNRHFNQIEKETAIWADNLTDDSFSEKDKLRVLETLKNLQPGKSVLTQKNQNNYDWEMENFLKGKLKGKTFDREELKNIILKRLLELSEPNSEFDTFLFHKVKIHCIRKGRHC